MRDLRILCLHGFRGSGAALRAQLQPLSAYWGPRVELVYVDAPPLAEGGPGWWNAVPIEGGEPHAKHYRGWAATRDWLVSWFEQSGPIDGVLGFSQGAALTGLLVGMRSAGEPATLERPLSFGFALLVSGFMSNDPVHAALYQAPRSFALPSLHLIGRSDRIVPREASLALAARFENPQVVEHDGGHVIASSAEVRATVSEFLTRQRES